MTDQDQPVLKRRGGIWGVIGLLLVAGIVAVSVIKYMDKGEGENPPPEQVTPPRHLLVISIDTLRADHLGCYGYGKPTSPSIDALAKEGVLFENHDTALFQIQEMLRTERISAEKAVLHEIETYNELVPGDSELSATIFVEYDDRAEREAMLEKLAGLEDKFYVLVEGERQKVVPDARNDRRDRTTAVHYVKFPLSPAAVRAIREKKPVRIGVDHPAYTAENELSPATVAALAEDLSG